MADEVRDWAGLLCQDALLCLEFNDGLDLIAFGIERLRLNSDAVLQVSRESEIEELRNPLQVSIAAFDPRCFVVVSQTCEDVRWDQSARLELACHSETFN